MERLAVCPGHSSDPPEPLAARAIISPVPAPHNERQALERERAELPAHVAQLPAGT
jgi:hypothetical protein